MLANFSFGPKKKDFIMKSNSVMVSIKLRLEVGNDEYIVLCNFDGSITSGFVVQFHLHCLT